MVDLNSTISQLDLIDIYGIIYPTATEYTFFSKLHGALTKIDHTLGHKNINEFKRIEIIKGFRFSMFRFLSCNSSYWLCRCYLVLL
jgi:hypothetical protein